MTVVDVDAIVAALAAHITALTDPGQVHTEDVYARSDLRDVIVSDIDGTPTLRAWWITGPTVTSRRPVEHGAGGIVERDWVYTLHHVEGITVDHPDNAGSPSPNATHIATIRTALAELIAALDADLLLGGTVHRKQPATITLAPHNTVLAGGIGVGYATISVTVTTLSS